MAIPNANDTTTVQSNMGGKRGKFSVHEHAHEKLMGVLTNLYEDPEGAVVREYLTNALDAQREAQSKDPNYVWRPVEVTTPSHFSKTYKIRDFGVGMSVEDIEKVYSQYGYSTKEHTNDQTGMLGLGSKCGLTYTGQFTVTGWKNGIKTTALITLNEDDVPEYVILDTKASDEPSGVEISIPVRDRNSFADKTFDFLKWWKSGEVLVNGSEPPKHDCVLVKSDPVTFNVNGKDVTVPVDVYLIESNIYRRYDSPTSYIIMGNVPYAVDSEYVDEGLRAASLGFAAYVPTGAVDFPPNRERLRYNTRTKDAVTKVSAGLFEAILDEKLSEITNATTYREAWTMKNNLPYHFANHAKARSFTYKGKEFPDRLAHTHMELDWDWQGHGQISERTYVNVATAMNAGTLIVTDVTQGTKPTSYFKKKVKFYMEENNISGSHAILTAADIDSVWLEWVPRIDAETIKSLKLPKDPNANTGPRVDAPYDVYYFDAAGKVEYDGSQTAVTAKAGTKLVYISPQDMKETYRKQGCTPQDFLRYLGNEYTLVVLGKNRFDKFLRTHTAIPAKKAVQERINFLVAGATDVEYQIGKLTYDETEFMRSVDVTKIDDPDLVALAKAVQDKSFTPKYKQAEQLHLFARRADILSTLPEKKNVKGNPCKRYPLLDHVGKRQMKHVVIYVNAVYAAEFAQQQP